MGGGNVCWKPPIDIILFATTFNFVVGRDFARWLFFLVANMGLQLALAIFIWFADPVLARRTIKSDGGLNLNVDARMLVSIGSFLIGFWLIMVKLPNIGHDLIRLFNEPSHQFNGEFNHAVLSFQFWPDLAVIVVGLWIMLQPFRLASLFMYLRNVGSHQKED